MPQSVSHDLSGFAQNDVLYSREESDMAKPIQVTLVRSPIGHPEKHRKILQALGLTYVNKIGDPLSGHQAFWGRSARSSTWWKSMSNKCVPIHN